MKTLIFTSLILIFLSCDSKEKFEKDAVGKLFAELKKQNNFESDLTENILFEFLKNVNIVELKNGKEIEREFLFENFKCDCRDKLSITYSKENNRFELKVYESYFEKDLDWCPETSYFFSFQLDKNKIKEVKLDQIAG